MGDREKYGLRPDGTPKGRGYFGEVRSRDEKGFSTELGADTEVDGEPLSYPLIHPQTSRKDLDHLVNGGAPTKEMHDAAIGHAMGRKKAGLSPFAGDDEEPLPLPVDQLQTIRAQVKQKRGY